MRINRIRLEFKVPTLFENIPKIIGINRIRLEFKVAWIRMCQLLQTHVLIESDWNLK